MKKLSNEIKNCINQTLLSALDKMSEELLQTRTAFTGGIFTLYDTCILVNLIG